MFPASSATICKYHCISTTHVFIYIHVWLYDIVLSFNCNYHVNTIHQPTDHPSFCLWIFRRSSRTSYIYHTNAVVNGSWWISVVQLISPRLSWCDLDLQPGVQGKGGATRQQQIGSWHHGLQICFVILRGSVFQLVWGWDCCPFSPFCMFGKSGMALLSIKLGTSFCWICNRNLKFSRLVMATAAMQQSALWILNDIDITDMSDITMETVWGTAWIASAPAILGLGRCGASKSRGILPPTSRRMLEAAQPRPSGPVRFKMFKALSLGVPWIWYFDIL